jgi:hypothetical protein
MSEVLTQKSTAGASGRRHTAVCIRIVKSHIIVPVLKSVAVYLRISSSDHALYGEIARYLWDMVKKDSDSVRMAFENLGSWQENMVRSVILAGKQIAEADEHGLANNEEVSQEVPGE